MSGGSIASTDGTGIIEDRKRGCPKDGLHFQGTTEYCKLARGFNAKWVHSTYAWAKRVSR